MPTYLYNSFSSYAESLVFYLNANFSTGCKNDMKRRMQDTKRT